MKVRRLIPGCLALCCIAAAPPPDQGAAPPAGARTVAPSPGLTLNGPTAPQTWGAYVDAAGKRHPWQVAPNRTLIWEGKPYLPVGGRFQVRSWAPNADDAAVAEDVAALKKLKEAGITDLYVEPAEGGLTRVAPSRIQAVVDALEAEGFTYGLAIKDGPAAVLVGYQIQPTRFRQSIQGVGVARFRVSDAAAAIYVRALPDGEVVDQGDAALIDGGAQVIARTDLGRTIAVLYPEKFYRAETSPLPDVWDDFDAYRDRVLETLGKVRFGPGLRFFLDPLATGGATTPEARRIVPSSKAALREWSVFLQRRYRTINDLTSRWRLTNVDSVPDFDAAAALVPLWREGKGLRAMWSRRTRARIPVDDFQSAFWTDLDAFKADSLRGYASQMGAALKRGIADVPVVVRASGSSPVLTDLSARDAIDGIALDAAPGSAVVEALPLAIEAPRPLWLTSLGIREDRRVASAGFVSALGLSTQLDALKGMGARGFYVDGLQLVGQDRVGDNLIRLPEQLKWLGEYRGGLETSGAAGLPGPESRATFYPASVGLTARALPGGGWLLPTQKPATTYDFGSLGRGYGLTEPGGAVFYLFNSVETRTVKIKIPKALVDARITWSPIEKGSRTKDVLTLTIGADPVRLTGFGVSIPLPTDAFETAIKDAVTLVTELRRRDHPDARRIPFDLERLRSRYQPDNTQASYTMLQTVLELNQKMRDSLRPFSYLWVDAEEPSPRISHYFDGTERWPGAVGGSVLTVGDMSEGGAPPSFSLTIPVNASRTYRLYIAATVDARFRLQLDGQTLGVEEAVIARPVGAPYGARKDLVWLDCGPLTLAPGERVLTLLPQGAMALDAVMLATEGTVPSGATPPPVVATARTAGTQNQ